MGSAWYAQRQKERRAWEEIEARAQQIRTGNRASIPSVFSPRAPEQSFPSAAWVSPVQTRRGAEQFERDLRQSLLDGTHGDKEVEQRPLPTVEEFSRDFLETYVVVNNKPSEQAGKRSILRLHVVPHLGELPLDQVARELEPFKAKLTLAGMQRKRLNNVLAVISKMLRYAEEREILERAPRVRLLKLPPSKFDFFDFDEYARLVQAARLEQEWAAAIIIGGDSGLRMGEIIALEWGDIDFVSGNMVIRRADWHGIVGSPKGGKERTVPMTEQLSRALKAHRHLRGNRVFLGADDKPITRNEMKKPLWRICRRAGLRQIGWHVLRHTFCSHLAMQGAVPKAIQELADQRQLDLPGKSNCRRSAGRPFIDQHDDALHAPGARGAARHGAAARSPGWRGYGQLTAN